MSLLLANDSKILLALEDVCRIQRSEVGSEAQQVANLYLVFVASLDSLVLVGH